MIIHVAIKLEVSDDTDAQMLEDLINRNPILQSAGIITASAQEETIAQRFRKLAIQYITDNELDQKWFQDFLGNIPDNILHIKRDINHQNGLKEAHIERFQVLELQMARFGHNAQAETITEMNHIKKQMTICSAIVEILNMCKNNLDGHT